DTGEALPAKKYRGSKKGGRIDLTGVRSPDCSAQRGNPGTTAPDFAGAQSGLRAPARLIIGEGIEKTLAVRLALARTGADLSGTAFWVAGDLGNIGGKGVNVDEIDLNLSIMETLRKRFGMNENEEPRDFFKRKKLKQSQIPWPDLTEPGIPIPDSVT